MDPKDALQQVARQVSACAGCDLHHFRKNAVPGEGPAGAEILLIGEGPGFYENEQGRPFVGPSGKFLDELLERGGLKRAEVFITNVVKCRPPKNRDPQPDELAACGDYLERQIEAINPRIIITLGRFSMARFMPGAMISSVHGKPKWVNGRLIIPMFHPAAALHQHSLKAELLDDFSRLPGFLEKARQAPQPKPAAPGKPALAADAPEPERHLAEQFGLFDAPPSPADPPQTPAAEEDHSGDHPPTQLSLF